MIMLHATIMRAHTLAHVKKVSLGMDGTVLIRMNVQTPPVTVKPHVQTMRDRMFAHVKMVSLGMDGTALI